MDSGLSYATLHDFNNRGVQLAITQLKSIDITRRPLTPSGHLTFSEAIVTGPIAALRTLGKPSLPTSCRNLTGVGNDSGTIQPIKVPRLGDRAWAYRITGEKNNRVWQWAEIIQTPHYILEIKIPDQEPTAETDPATLLPTIAEIAYTKAQTVLR